MTITTTKGLTFAELRHAHVERNKILDPRGLNGWSLAEWMTALVGEVGEAANIIKKMIRDRDRVAGNTESAADYVENLRKEFADVMIYLDLIAAAAGFNLAEATIDKFNEVSVRLGLPDRILPADVAAPGKLERLINNLQHEQTAGSNFLDWSVAEALGWVSALCGYYSPAGFFVVALPAFTTDLGVAVSNLKGMYTIHNMESPGVVYLPANKDGNYMGARTINVVHPNVIIAVNIAALRAHGIGAEKLRMPGMGWKLSPEAAADIKAIEYAMGPPR